MFVSECNDFVLKVKKFNLGAKAIVEVDNKKFTGVVKEIVRLSDYVGAFDDYDNYCEQFSSNYCGEFATDFDIFYVGIELV